MLELINGLSTRELAITIWIMILFIWAFSSAKVRPSAIRVVQTFFAWKLTLGYILMGAYIVGLLAICRYTGIWNKTSPATVLIWVICVAFTSIFKTDDAKKDGFFKSKIKENFKIIIVVEFITHFYTLNLLAELLLVPLLALVGCMMAIAERDPEYDLVRKTLNIFMAITGLFLTGYAIRMAIVDFQRFATVATLENFLLPIILTLAFLPFLYLLTVYATYETLFIRLQFFIQDTSLLKYTRRRTLLVLHFRLGALNQFSERLFELNLVDRHSVNEALATVKRTPPVSCSEHSQDICSLDGQGR